MGQTQGAQPACDLHRCLRTTLLKHCLEYACQFVNLPDGFWWCVLVRLSAWNANPMRDKCCRRLIDKCRRRPILQRTLSTSRWTWVVM